MLYWSLIIFFLIFFFKCVLHIDQAHALSLGSRRPLCLSAHSTFNNMRGEGWGGGELCYPQVLMVLYIYKWCSPFQGGYVAQILKTNSGSLRLGNNLLDDNWCQGSSGFLLLPFGIFIHNLLHNWPMCISAMCFWCYYILARTV